jgi:hypothetical protein
VPARQDVSNSLISTGELYRGFQYQKEESALTLFFRDHALSDSIGFVYSGWDPERAADDFVGKLSAIHENLVAKKVKDPIVSVILDGENAWEYYVNDGHDFLETLYNRIEKTPWLATCTYEQYLGAKPTLAPLSRLFAGSWISHNFAVWIGHSEDNWAWDLLGKVRDELVAFEQANPLYDKQKTGLAWKEIMIAEGSDWCWWFGPDHVGPNNDDFDRLFRSHLVNVYKFTDRDPPADLFQPVRTSFIDAHYTKPVDFIRPKVDGIVTHYYEWQQAGYFDCSKAGSTMHRSERLLKGIFFGFDEIYLYLRLDWSSTVTTQRFSGYRLELQFYDAKSLLIAIEPKEKRALLNGVSVQEIFFALKDILEVSIPLNLLPRTAENNIMTRLSVKEGNNVLETWPPSEALKIELPNPREIPWTV